MSINITGRHANVSDAMKEYVKDKLEPILQCYPQIEHTHVILDIQKFRHIVEVVVQGKTHLRVEAQDVSDDMYVSIDRVADKVDRQLRRSRDKIVSHKSAKNRAKLVDFEKQIDQVDTPG